MLDVLDLHDNQMRVITPDVGGGFGPKGAFYPEYPTIAVSAKLLGRPVKWIEDRHENFLATHQERDQCWDVEIAVDGEAKIRGLRGRLIHDAGAFVPWGIVLPWIAATTVPGPYVLPNYKMDIVVALTNKISTTPVRGAGRPQGVFVMERLMDRVARELELDPAEVRRRNFIMPEQMPYQAPRTLPRNWNQQLGRGNRARPLRRGDRAHIGNREGRRLYRGDPTGAISQDHARADRRRLARHQLRGCDGGDRRHR